MSHTASVGTSLNLQVTSIKMPDLFYFAKSIRRIIEKENFDFSRPDLNLYNFHSQLRILFGINGIFFKDKTSSLRLIWPMFCTIMIFMNLALQSTIFYGGLITGDYALATESFCYVVMLISVPLILLVTYFYTNEICELIEDMNQSFIFVCNLEAKYRDTFMAGQIRMWKFCCAWLAYCGSLGAMYVLFPMMLNFYRSLFGAKADHVTRRLPFPAWLPVEDPYATPYFEIIFFLEAGATYVFVQTTVVYIYLLFHLLLHYYYIVDMIILDFEVLFDDLDVSVVKLHRYNPRRQQVQLVLNSRIKRIVTCHISVFKAAQRVSAIYRGPLVYQMIFSAIILCLITYQFAEKISHGHIDFFLILLGIAISSQLYISCYVGTMLRNKAFKAGEACWNCGWHVNPLGRLVRQDLIIFIMRAQQPITIRFIGLPGLELETFTSIMTSAYSYFNMLRQYIHD